MRFFRIWLMGDESDRSLAFLNSPPRGLGLYDYCMARGERIGSNYPRDAKAYLEAKSPGIKLASLLGNTLSYLIVCTAMKDAIAGSAACELELLPFTLYNHKKRIHSKDYWIVNPLGTIDCLNRDASEIEYLDDTKAEIVAVERFVLERSKVAAAPNIFRVPEDPKVIFVSQVLVQSLQKQQFSNVMLREIEVK